MVLCVSVASLVVISGDDEAVSVDCSTLDEEGGAVNSIATNDKAKATAMYFAYCQRVRLRLILLFNHVGIAIVAINMMGASKNIIMLKENIADFIIYLIVKLALV
jgi:hypothetical protein